MLNVVPIKPVLWLLPLPSFVSKNDAGKSADLLLEDNVDKKDVWGHFSTGVVIAHEKADAAVQILICSSRCSCDSWSFKCNYQG